MVSISIIFVNFLHGLQLAKHFVIKNEEKDNFGPITGPKVQI